MPELPQRLYLAGPMSGYPEFNYPLFNQVAKHLRAQGHRVFNPAENRDGGRKRPRAFYMRLDIPALLESDGIVTLPGWRHSRGASLEVWLALDLGLPVHQCLLADGAITLKNLDGLTPSHLPFGGRPSAHDLASPAAAEQNPAPGLSSFRDSVSS